MRRNAVSQPAALQPNGPAADSATRLLAEYTARSPFFFASPKGTLLAQEAFATVPEAAAGASPATLAQRVSRSLDEARKAGHPDPVAVGAVPFDLSAPARLMVARNLRSADRLSLRSAEFRYAAEYDKTLGLDRLMYRAAGSAETRREDLRRGNAGSAEACLIPMRAGPCFEASTMELALALLFPMTSPGIRFSSGTGIQHPTAEDRLRMQGVRQ